MHNKSFSLHINSKIKSFKKKIEIDGDKSISIRSFLIGSISHDISEVKNVLESEDVISTINCLKKLGIKILKIKAGHYRIFGKGLGSLFSGKKIVLNFGNSGTLARLLIGILSTTPNINVKMIGDKSLNKRNMLKLLVIMEQFGAEFFPKKKYNFPLSLVSSSMPVGINYTSGISAQLKSAVILAGLNSFGVTTINEKNKSRDHTEKILLKNKNIIKINKNIIKIFGKEKLDPLRLVVPGDPSSAAFFCAITLLRKNSNLLIKKVGLNKRRIGFYLLLKKSGAKIKFLNIKKINNELVGDIYIQSSKIKPIKASSKYYPSTADEYPILFILAGLTKGVSTFKGISDLSNKESSRAHEIKKILSQIGIKSQLKKDQIKIFGKDELNKGKIIRVGNLGDHRICLAASCLSFITGIKCNIKNFETVNTSFPSYLKIIKKLGGKFEIKKNS
tara:strand:+ start:988 stop:2328 length:1341 start_codon:yes stop_codon:yes gene_type:complete